MLDARFDTHARDRAYWAILVVVLGAALLRLPGLSSFPGVMADEGLWTSSTKNYLLFGDWFMDGRTHVLLSPVFHAMSVLAFWLLGPSIESARLVSALASTASVPLMYGLALRVARDQRIALTSALIMAASAMYAFAGRLAMIESTQVALVLLAAFLVAGRTVPSAAWAGVVFGLALLTKANLVILAPVLALFALRESSLEDVFEDRGLWVRTSLFLGVALTLAGATNLALYLAEPERYHAAYLFELQGNQFEAGSNPAIRVGRFGIDPVLIGRSVLELIREAPFQMVLCMVGAAAALTVRSRVHVAFRAWLVVATGFVLVQTFQPLRYFFLAAPAYCLFAAVGLLHLSDPDREPGMRQWNRVQRAVVALYVAFNVGYLGMNAVANQDDRLETVEQWVREHTSPDDRIIAAGYFCLNLPNRAYAHYHLGGHDIEELTRNLRELGIDYVIYDEVEWSADMRPQLEERLQPVQEWSFGAVFRVPPETWSSR